MKIDRLIGILSILLQHEKVTAPYLADKFEVSRRTINRDIESLCKAGIPIVTIQGAKGGITIMEGYRIDKALLTKPELQAIFTGLKSLDSISGNNQYKLLMDKLSLQRDSVYQSDQHILIDLSSFYKTTLAPKIETIKGAIEKHHLISFDYYSPKGEGRRLVEPYLLVFQWSSWYVWSYCLTREDSRLFKLNRLLNLKVEEETFKPRDWPPYQVEPAKAFPPSLPVTALFEPEVKFRLIEEYGVDSFTYTEDGKLLFEFFFSDKNHVFDWILGFGDKVELLEPRELRTELFNMARGIAEKYSVSSSES